MEEQLNTLAVTHLLQQTLRSLCYESSHWVYAVFWRILPRNYPPPKWDLHFGASPFDRTRGNKRNWILAWEDGFCNFTASALAFEYKPGDVPPLESLQPEIFFKMSHEIYNFGEGVIGKVASDYSHKWVFSEPQDHETNNLNHPWNNPADFYPRTWNAQFQSGIKTIALIAVGEGVVQLGSLKKVEEDPSYILLLRKKFTYLENIPGVFLPHPTSPEIPVIPDTMQVQMQGYAQQLDLWNNQQVRLPSITSLDALLSKLPAVGPTSGHMYGEMPVLMADQKQNIEGAALKEEMEVNGGDTSASINYFVNVANPMM